MKYSFALAMLMAVVSVEAIHMSAEPVLKKEEPKKDEAAIKAKFDAKAEEKKVQDGKAVEAETKKMNEGEAETDRKSKMAASAYDKNMADQAAETKRIQELRVRPKESIVVPPGPESDLSAGEHWTHNMPDHIIDNKVGPTAPFDSPAPVASPAAVAAAAADAGAAAPVAPAAAAAPAK